jgi:hypothetical protein
MLSGVAACVGFIGIAATMIAANASAGQECIFNIVDTSARCGDLPRSRGAA